MLTRITVLAKDFFGANQYAPFGSSKMDALSTLLYAGKQLWSAT
jgi:hypothetical protein